MIFIIQNYYKAIGDITLGTSTLINVHEGDFRLMTNRSAWRRNSLDHESQNNSFYSIGFLDIHQC